MKLNKEISNYLNGSYFPCLTGEIKELKKRISMLPCSSIKNINKIYDSLYKNKKIKSKKSIKNIKTLNIDNKDFLIPLKEFKDFINHNFTDDELIGAYIHGSLATNDYVEGYSDFDALLIIKKQVFNSEKKLKKLKNKITKANTFLYLLDPLQHHELFIITEFDMNYYFEPIFPLELFKYAKRITPYGKNLKFTCLEDKDYLKKIFNQHKKYFFDSSRFKKKSPFFIKNYVQNTLLLPTIYYQTKNKKYIYKKFSFEKVKKEFSSKNWNIINKCTQIRNNCPYKSIYSYSLRKFIGINFHYKFLKLLHRYFDKNNSKCMLKILGKGYLQESKNLINEMEKKLKNAKI